MSQPRPSPGGKVFKAIPSGDGPSGPPGKAVTIVPSYHLGGSGTKEAAATLFHDFDTQQRNFLDHEQLMAALAEFGAANGLSAKKLGEILAFGGDPHARTRSYSFLEFASFYERLSNFQAKAHRQERIKAKGEVCKIPDGAESDEDLKKVFVNYCKYTAGQGRTAFDEADPRMSSTQFVKLCNDMGLMQPTGPLNVVVVDVVFHKCKIVGQRRLGFPQLLLSLAAVSDAAQMNAFELARMLGLQIKPRATFFAPQPVQFRQETRQFTLMTDRVAGSSGPSSGGEQAQQAQQPQLQAEDSVAAAPPPPPPPAAPRHSDSGAAVESLARSLEQQASQLDGLQAGAAVVRQVAADITELSKGVATAKATAGEVAVLQSSVRGIKERMAVQAAVAASLGAAVETHKGEVEGRLARLERLVETMQGEIQGLKTSNSSLRADNEALSQAVMGKDGAVAAGGSGVAAAARAQMEARSAALEARNAALEEAVAQLQLRAKAEEVTRAAAAAAAASASSVSIESLDARTCELEEALRSADGGLRALQAAVPLLEDRVAKGAPVGTESPGSLSARLTEVESILRDSKLARASAEGFVKGSAPVQARVEALERSNASLEESLRSSRKAAGSVKGLEVRVGELEDDSARSAAMASQLAALEKRLNEGLLTRAKATPDVLDKRVSAVEATLAASSERIVGSSAAGGGGGAAGEGALRQRLADVERGQKQLSGEVEGLKLSGSDWRDTSGRLEKAIHALGSKAALLNETQSAKGLELERRLAGVERHRHELEESIVSMQAAQDAMLEEMTTMQAAAGGQGSRHSAPSRPTTANPDENLLRATQRELRALAEDYNGFRARMESNFDTAIMFIKGDLEQLEGRIAAVEATRELVLVELRQLENHVLARLGFVGDDVEAVRRTVNDVVGDLSVLASKVIAPSRQAGDPGDNTSGMVPPGALADLEVQLQAHLDALFQGMLSVTEAKFASAESLKHATDKCRANDDVILKALKEVDRRLHERVGSHDELFLRMARQVDIVQRYLQQKDSEFDAAHVPRLTISTGSNGTALQSSSLGAAMTALTSAQHKMGSRQGSVDPVQTQHGGQLPSLQGGHSQRQLLREHSSVDGMDPRQMQQVVGGYSMGPLGRERSSDGMSPRLQMPQVAEHGAGQAQMGPVGQLGQRQPIHSQVSRQRSVSEQGRHDPRFRNVRMEGV